MTARLWRAAGAMAALWRTSPEVQGSVAWMRAQAAAAPGGDWFLAQPLCLPYYVPAAQSAKRDTAVHVAHGYIAMIEWLRSRLPGYPFGGTPQLASSSPWTTFTLSMRIPWLTDRREWQLQNQPRPPTFPFLPDRSAQAEAGMNLGDAVTVSRAAAEVNRRWHALTASDQLEMEAASTAMRQARYPGTGETRADDDLRRLAWQEAILDQALRSLPERASAFTDALADADRMIQHAAALFSQLATSGRIRSLRYIDYVDQLHGPDGWTTVSSDSFLLDPIRTLEIIAFDYPYPRGVMLVEGTATRFPNEPIPGQTTVRGRILADSEELAASAIPVHEVLRCSPGSDEGWGDSMT